LTAFVGAGKQTHSDLLPLAILTSLHDPHQVRMFPLLLGLRASTRGVGDIDTVLGHDGEARKPGLSDLLGILFGGRLLAGSASTIPRRRSHANGAISRITKVHRGGRAGGVHGRAEGGLRFGGALLKGEDVVGLDQGAGVEVDGGMVVEIDGYLGQFAARQVELAR